MGKAAEYFSFLLLRLLPPGLFHLLSHFTGGEKSCYQCKQFQKMQLKTFKPPWYQNELPCFEMLWEKHCPESHKVLQPLAGASEHRLVVEGESRSWDCKSQRAKSQSSLCSTFCTTRSYFSANIRVPPFFENHSC